MVEISLKQIISYDAAIQIFCAHLVHFLCPSFI